VEETEREDSLEEQVERRNYVAAVPIAQRLGEPQERIRELQQAAIKQYITEYRNVPGTMALLERFQFADDELDRLLEAIIEEVRRSEGKKPSWAGKRYDTKTTKYLDVEEWIARYGNELKRARRR
jgi:predicted transcriptional regulator